MVADQTANFLHEDVRISALVALARPKLHYDVLLLLLLLLLILLRWLRAAKPAAVEAGRKALPVVAALGDAVRRTRFRSHGSCEEKEQGDNDDRKAPNPAVAALDGTHDPVLATAAGAA